ncbi:prepilin [Escherichia coli]|uniref:hypothetical protein n=1 Tax=Escherichia coli TaxID=562 RepID=UPI001917F9C8|nr:hypothetical protein [Escherichia coli]CAD6176304.1 prepilin [Escherichia coli]
MISINRHRGLGIIEICLVLIVSLLFIYITAYVLHLTKVFSEAREVANDLRSVQQSVENGDLTDLTGMTGYKVLKSNDYFLIIENSGKISGIDKVFIVCTFVKDSCGYVNENKMKYISVLRPEVSLESLGFKDLNSEAIRVAILFRV